MLIDRPIFKPDEKVYWPDKNKLEWHRKKKFGMSAAAGQKSGQFNRERNYIFCNKPISYKGLGKNGYEK